MPHSSGGGSHGGGSHGGGSHGGGSHGSGFGAGSYNRVRTTAFPGAMRYVYYENRMPHYIYSKADLDKSSRINYIGLVVLIPYLISVFTMLSAAYHHPKKLSMAYRTDIIISDRACVIDNDASLKATLTVFRDKTGITPAVVTVYNESWQGSCTSLEQYAYDLYVNSFRDESHWLIVYSTPKLHNGFENWYWEGMQGDDTDNILITAVTDSFRSELQKDLTARTRFTVGKAIETAFQSITPTVMNTTIQWPMVFIALAMLGAAAVYACYMLGLNPKAKKYETAVPCPEILKEQDVCEYCGGIYVVGTCTECPHCGANIKPRPFREVPKNPAPYRAENTAWKQVNEITPEPVDETPQESVDETEY